MPNDNALREMAQKLRRHSLLMTSEAGSGHPTSCLSSAEIVSTLFFQEMLFDPKDPRTHDTDLFVLSKGHAAPILYAALYEAGAIAEDPLTLRKFMSPLEGHPTPNCPWVRVATGSLGQGLSVGCGMAYARKLDGNPGRIYVLLGDGECAEGSVWEAIQFAATYRLDNLCALIDVNRLGQSGPTFYEHTTAAYVERLRAFGWATHSVDGHDVAMLTRALSESRNTPGRPSVIVAKTQKGKGVSFLEGKDGWHGKPLKKGDELNRALSELGDPKISIPISARRYGFTPPPPTSSKDFPPPAYRLGEEVATREAYGTALVTLGRRNPSVIVLDGDVKNSTYSEKFKASCPDRFVECYIAEQNMVGAALGMGAEGKIPFASSFACFLTRAYDFIRMAAYSRPRHLILCGSHAGISIGEDGPSQMGLEDIAMMRAIFGSTVLYPCDAVSAERLVFEAAQVEGVVYLRTTRPKTKVLYSHNELFPIGGAKVLRRSNPDQITLVAAGITVHEALAAYERLKAEGIAVRVIDAYSIKPLDRTILKEAAAETQGIVTVEDHSVCGGLGEAVAGAIAGGTRMEILGIRDIPRSGAPKELLEHFGISTNAIVAAVKRLRR